MIFVSSIIPCGLLNFNYVTYSKSNHILRNIGKVVVYEAALYQNIITWEFWHFNILSQRNDFMFNTMMILIFYLIVSHCPILHNGLWIHAILITGHNYDKLEINILSYQNQRYLTKVCNHVHTSVFVYVWKICMWMS